MATVILLLFTFMQLARAGGPRYIAGISYFNQGTAGTPLIWAQGAVNYYTDQGPLSATVPGPQGDALVADAFSQWTSISTVALSVTHAGQLVEDVSGSNVYRNSDGTITMPADIMPTATGTPVGIVYDADGTVTDALLGQGAGDASECFGNAVYGGVDNFGVQAFFLHALVVINGNCVVQLPDPDVEYRLVRILGRVLGLGWSQMNLNVQTGNPRPTADDYVGFSIMHAVDSPSCVPISSCYSNGGKVNPYQPKMDDQAALSRLYPGSTFSASTARIHGNVYFANSSGEPGQGMQGVNVVARWIDPTTGLPSGAYAAASVSGFLFAGNVGTTVTGFNDATGLPFNRYGSNNPALEGFFDLAGLQIPNGGSAAQYKLTVEAVDPFWSATVVPYQPWQVLPSGSAQAVVVNVTLGGDVPQDIVMQDSAVQKPDWFGPTSYTSPAPLPVAGDWAASLDPYGGLDYFWFTGQANRTLSVLVTALDDSSAPSESKAQPVIGMWQLSDPGTFPAPANTPSAFNSAIFGTTVLNAQLLEATSFRVGIADIRGDGRPDYRYHARLLYGDHVSPTRASVAGGTALAIAGYGFQENTAVMIGSGSAPQLAASANQIFVTASAQADGVQDITLLDPPTLASSILSGVVTYGAGPSDTLSLVAGSNPGTPVGGQAPNPIRVQALAPDGVTPVAGASVFFTASPAAAFSACSGGESCTVLTDQSGQASTLVSVLSAGVITITAQLAPASYKAPQQVQTTLLGTESSLDVSLLSQYAWIAQGSTVNLTLTARVLSNGVPINKRTVNFYLDKGSATLNPPSAKTNSSGYASSTLQISSMPGDVQVSACVEPGDAPCSTFYGTAVPPSSLQLQAVAGDLQFIAVGTAFQPITVQVTDNSMPAHPVLGVSVVFQSLVGRTNNNDAPIVTGGDTTITRDPLPIILGMSQAAVTSDANGLATMQPSTGGFQGALAILGTVTAGAGSLPFQLQSLWPMTN
ncbi:MAG: IPT/TIG domain-containing protein [Terriglobales bacterium]